MVFGGAVPEARVFFFFGEQAGEIYSSSAKQASHMF